MILFRPVGTIELNLIKQGNYSEFPPRLPEQDGKGYVTRFTVDDEYIGQFDVHTVGNHVHQELWIPAEELPRFNSHIIGLIEVIREFGGDVTK